PELGRHRSRHLQGTGLQADRGQVRQARSAVVVAPDRVACSKSEYPVSVFEYTNTMNTKRDLPAAYVQPYRYPSPTIPLAAIRRFARQMAERFHPDRIILFGSYAYGRPHNESDVDLLVIMPAYDVVAQAIRISGAFRRLFSHSIIVRTPKQIERGLREDDC